MRRFRRFMKKPVRRVRRAVRRAFRQRGTSRGKGKRRRLHGRGVISYLTSLTDIEFEEVLFGGRGKGRGKGILNTTGKGKGRKQNPMGPDGNTMTCDTCGSAPHIWKDCPNKGKGKGSASVNVAQEFEEIQYVDYDFSYPRLRGHPPQVPSISSWHGMLRQRWSSTSTPRSSTTA